MRGRFFLTIKSAFFKKLHFSDGVVWTAVLAGKTRDIRPKSGAEKRHRFVRRISICVVFVALQSARLNQLILHSCRYLK